MQNYPTMSSEHSGKKLLVTTEDILHKSHFKFRILGVDTSELTIRGVQNLGNSSLN